MGTTVIPDTAPAIAPVAPVAAPVAPVADGPAAPDLANPGTIWQQAIAAQQSSPENTVPEEPVAGEAAPEGEGEQSAALEEIPVWAKLTIPLPNGNGENGTTNAGLLELPMPNQETHDALKYHLKQSARAGRLDERLQAASGDTAIVQFLDERPADGLLWLAKANPEAATQFLDTQVRSNPMRIAQQLIAMGFNVTVDDGKQETIQARADLAALQAQTSMQSGQETFQRNLNLEKFKNSARDVVADVGQTLGLASDSEDFKIFTMRAAERMAKVHAEKGMAATQTDLIQALQPLVQAMTGKATQPATRPAAPPAPNQPRVPSGVPEGGQFAALQAKNDKFRRIAGPVSQGAPPAVTKIKPDMSLYDVRGDRR